MERIWSVLEMASKCMKEMGYANRAAFFNDVMYEYGEELNAKTGDGWFKTDSISKMTRI